MTEPEDAEHELTIAIQRMSNGEVPIEASVIELLVAELRGIAIGYARGQREEHTLQATALVNEAFVKLIGNTGLADVRDRKHFFRIAARAMRQILVDHARRRCAEKRGGGGLARLTLNEDLVGGIEKDQDLLELDRAVTELAELDSRQARIVELRFFSGFEVEEVATALEISVSTVERDWRMARAWLGRRLGSEEEL